MTPPDPAPSRFPALCLVVVLVGPVASQETDEAAIPKAADLTATLKQVEENATLEAALKTSLVETYKKALEQVRAGDGFRAKSDELDTLVRAAPSRLTEIKEKLSTPPSETAVEAPADATLSQLEQRLAEKEEAYKARQAALAAVTSEQEERVRKRTAIPRLVTAAREKLAEVTSQLATPPPADEAPALTAAKRALSLAQKRAFEEEILSYEKEVQSYAARAELIQARRSEAERALTESERVVKAWRTLVDERRRMESAEAERKAREAAEAAKREHPAIKLIATENSRLAAERPILAERGKKATARLDEARDTLRRTRETFRGLARKVEAARFTSTTGVLLRTQKAKLPDLRELASRISAREDEIASVETWLVDLEAKRRATTGERVREFLELAESSSEDAVNGELRERLTKLVEDSRLNYVIPLAADYENYANKLADLDGVERELVAEVERFSDFIARRILWSRSAKALQIADAKKTWVALLWCVSPDGWVGLGSALRSEMSNNSTAFVLAGLVLIICAVIRPWLVARLRWLGEEVKRTRVTVLAPTLKAFLVTVVLSLLWPCSLWIVGWCLSLVGKTSALASAVGTAFLALGTVVFTLEILRHTCRDGGLGERHFGWRGQTGRVVRNNTALLSVFVLPLIFIAALMEGQRIEEHKEALGRLAFVGALAAFTVFVARVLRPETGAFSEAIRQNPGSIVSRFRYLWYGASVLAPLVLIVMAVIGYHYTSMELAWRLLTTLWVSLSLILIRALLLRWLLLVRRRLAMEQARAKRKAELEQKAKEPTGETHAANEAPLTIEEPEIDLTEVNAQTTRLLNTAVLFAFLGGLWAVWVDVLPALGILNDVHLGWTKTVKVAETVLERSPGGEETAVERVVPKDVPVTAGDLGLACLIGILAFVGARNLPGLLQIALLQRLPLDSGARYAVTAVSGYVITLVGVVAAFAIMGVGWSKVQWLAAALTVGLGFGLQEIFANFVSGLIIFFERPVRVGDVVTIDNVSGTVTRIQIRATTITDWDRKEFVVPNKDFITGRLLNWTLSNTTSRIVVTVGVAYGSDVERALSLLVKVARENPNVLADPEPRATFELFGDSSLNLLLRCFIPNLDVRLPTVSELHKAIDREFRAAGIEIAFPQRDLHIRSSDGTINVTRIEEESGIPPVTG